MIDKLEKNNFYQILAVIAALIYSIMSIYVDFRHKY